MESQVTFGSAPPMLMQYYVTTCDLVLLAVHCQLQVICAYIHDNGDVDDFDVEATRVIAHLLTSLGQVLDNIEACTAQDTSAAGNFPMGDSNHLTYVRSYFFDVRELVDDLIV